MECRDCAAYDLDKRHCNRYPMVYEKGLSDWCLEFKAKEVKPDAVEERKVESSSVPEYKGTDALWPTAETGSSDSDEQGGKVQEQAETVKRRGWPRGKPRK